MVVVEKRKRRKSSMRLLKKNWICYLFVLPMLIYILIFNYLPMYGIQLAFKDYRVTDGIWGSAWVGLKHFKTFFDRYQYLSTKSISALHFPEMPCPPEVRSLHMVSVP